MSHRERLLFISHKHVDSKIADVIREFVNERSGGRIKVFQSSSPWAGGPHLGRNLNQELKDTLWQTSVLILVYTQPDQDWSYCMWECGVATLPESPDTRIILFQCGQAAPALFAGQVNVNARQLKDLQRFAQDFLTSADFFPGQDESITQFVSGSPEVLNAAQDLQKALSTVLPPEKEEPPEEWPAWPYLQLELGMEHVKDAGRAEKGDKLEQALSIIRKKCVISACDSYCQRLFGTPSFRGMTLDDLVGRWKEAKPQAPLRWVDVLCDQILDGAQWKFPKSVWVLMQAVDDDTWYGPVLTRVRKIPAQQRMQFEVYFHKFEMDPQKKVVQLTPPPEATSS